jgi:hypothetical protein
MGPCSYCLLSHLDLNVSQYVTNCHNGTGSQNNLDCQIWTIIQWDYESDLELAEDPMANGESHIHRYFQIFIYFIKKVKICRLKPAATLLLTLIHTPQCDLASEYLE